MSQTLDTLAIRLLGDTVKYEQASRNVIAHNQRMEQSVHQVSHATEDMLHKVNHLVGEIAAAFTIEKGFELVKHQIEEVTHLAHQAEKFDMGVNTLIGFQYEAKLMHTDVEALTHGFAKMQRTIAEASLGSQEAQRSFSLLKLKSDELLTMTADKQFLKIAEAIRHMGNATERTAASMLIFGRGGSQLMNVIMKGEEGFKAASKEAEALGLTLSEKAVGQIEEADRAMIKLQASVEGLTRAFAVGVAPAITTAANALAKFVASAGQGGSKDWQASLGNRWEPLGPKSGGLGIVPGGGADVFRHFWGGEAGQRARERDFARPNPRLGEIGKGAEHKESEQSRIREQLLTEQNKTVEDLAKKLRGDLPAGLLHTSKASEIAELALKGLTKAQIAYLNSVAAKRDTDDFLKSLKMQYETFGMTKDAAKLYELQLNKIISTTDAAQAKTYLTMIKHRELEKGIHDLTAKMQEQITTFGQGGDAAEIYKLKLAGATDTELRAVVAMQKQIKELERLKELKGEAKSITEKFEEPMIRFRKEQDKLSEMFRRNFIDATTYRNAMKDLQHQFNKDYRITISMGVNAPSMKDWQAMGSDYLGMAAQQISDIPTPQAKGPRHVHHTGGSFNSMVRGIPKHIVTHVGDTNPFFDQARADRSKAELAQLRKPRIGRAGGLKAAAAAGDFVGNADDKGPMVGWQLKGNEKFDAIVAELKGLRKDLAHDESKDKHKQVTIELATLGIL